MAISTAVYSAHQWRVAFAQQAAWGTANTTQGDFQELHVTELVMPDFSGILSDETKRSNGKRIMDATDVFRSNAGSEYTVQVTTVLTKLMTGRLMYGALQQIASDAAISPYLKTFTVDGTVPTSTTPAKFFTLLFYNPASNECIALKDVVIRTLTQSCDVGANAGRAKAAITFVTGAMPTWDATATPASWDAPGVDYYLMQTLVTKTLAGSDIVLGKYEFTIENGATRVGYSSTGDAEGFSFPLLDITGSIDVKYDANTKDLIDKWFLSPTGGSADSDLVLQHFADGNAQELEMTFHTILTAPPALAGTEKGVFQTVNWRAVTESSTAAATIKVADEIDEGWAA